MFCMNCGKKLPNEAKFCFNCGKPTAVNFKEDSGGKTSTNGAKTTTQSINSVQLRCKNCNGVMNVDEDHPVLECPFCHSKEIILEGDKVTIQRIKSKAYKDVEFGKQQTYREVELGKKELEIKDDNSRFKRTLISSAIILIGAIIASLGGLLVGIIMIVAGAISLKHSRSRKESDGPVDFPKKGVHATKADVEMAKIKAKERENKGFLIMWIILLGVSVGGFVLMWLLGL